ncbi:hypothetical protein G7Y89_g13298 [Cudoniella acicularis]|uniref:ATPase AAA-type core domain-containing protein n=1 Tax=Cudoniella acicularis TaxID=354080 RepID=A0A8H4VYU5_9HELO|nr:hypothetical protein G7Y89_g13298 [Cudoniella acicularis]
MLFGMFFAFWRFMEIITLIPTLGMLAYFVNAYASNNALTPNYILVLFIVSVLAAVWAICTLFTYHRTKNNALFVSFIDLCFVGALIAGVYELRGISNWSCSSIDSSSNGPFFSISFGSSTFDVSGYHINTNKTCAMLKASFAFGIMNCVFFFITSLMALFVGRGQVSDDRKDTYVSRETYHSHGRRRSGSHRSSHHSTRRSHSGRRSASVLAELSPPPLKAHSPSCLLTLVSSQEVISQQIQPTKYLPHHGSCEYKSHLWDVVWDESAFKKLIIEPKRRDLICSLVKSHRNDKHGFDDIIRNKGKGLVGLLSRGPGVGKTLTAEVVAELTHKLLYTISAGELGTGFERVDMRLQMALDITRSNLDMLQNAMVIIDTSYLGRIHFKINYPALDEKSRAQVWKDFLSTIPPGIAKLSLSDENITRLAQIPLNGREV